MIKLLAAILITFTLMSCSVQERVQCGYAETRKLDREAQARTGTESAEIASYEWRIIEAGPYGLFILEAFLDNSPTLLHQEKGINRKTDTSLAVYRKFSEKITDLHKDLLEQKNGHIESRFSSHSCIIIDYPKQIGDQVSFEAPYDSKAMAEFWDHARNIN